MNAPWLLCFGLAVGSLTFAEPAVAQAEAVVRSEAARTVRGPVTSMRHVGARTRPAVAVATRVAPASFGRQRFVRTHGVHFRH